MKFFKMMLPFVVVLGDYFTKTGRMGYDVNSNTVKYKTPSGVKEIATTEQLGGNSTPQWFVGQVVQSLGTNVPNGFARLDGQQVSKTTYADLYSVIGDSYDDGNVAIENFKLPDLAKRTLLGVDGADTNFSVGSLGGNETIGLEHLPEIKPTFNVGDVGNSDSSTGNFLGQGGGGNADVYSDVLFETNNYWVNGVGSQNPEPFYQPFIAVNMLVFTGVYG